MYWATIYNIKTLPKIWVAFFTDYCRGESYFHHNEMKTIPK